MRINSGGQIDLCGHATLATAYVLANHYDTALTHIRFKTLSGELIVVRDGVLYKLDFLSRLPRPHVLTQQMVEALGIVPLET